MTQPGRASPVKEVAGKATHPAKEASSPKWVFHLPKARRKMKRVATPHPVKIGGNSKREALTSLSETGRARKKIVFESDDEPAAVINGESHATAGAAVVSSPSKARLKGRWSRKARPGPFEAVHLSMGRFEVEPGILPLCATELTFSMGKKENLARDKADGPGRSVLARLPDGAAGNGLTGARPEEVCTEMMADNGDGRSSHLEKDDARAHDQLENVAGAAPPGVAGFRQEEVRPEEMRAGELEDGQPTHLEKVGVLVTMDEDNLHNGNGANLLSGSTICVAPFLEMPSHHVLPSTTCELLSSSEFKFKFEEGDASLTKDGPLTNDEDAAVKSPAPEPSPDSAGMPPEPDTTPENLPEPGEEASQPAGVEYGGASRSDPVPLDVAHAEVIGTAGSCEGVPLLTFSNDETRFLADKIGFAVIGKFSHTIPMTHQIQKSLSNIHFIDGFKWKFVNAKHILIQFRDVRDYGRMLNGPNGAPVWHIEHHPMRVFKWTPEFDTSFESPIAVVWCKVIGLPIHLYDQSALIAIGKLLGKPTQVDHATFDQTRLSYARICIEIDISSPPPDEIILNILGKDSRYKVVWDRIPTYCVECKHVGHVREECRILGKKTTPKKGTNNQGTKPRRADLRRPNYRREWRPKGTKEDGPNQKPDHASANKAEPNRGPSEGVKAADGPSSSKAEMVVQEREDEDGFQLVSRRRKGNMNFSLHHTQAGPREASYREKLLMGSNVATVTFGDTDMGIIDPGGSTTTYVN